MGLFWKMLEAVKKVGMEIGLFSDNPIARNFEIAEGHPHQKI